MSLFTVNFTEMVLLCLLTHSQDHHELKHPFYSSVLWAPGCLGLVCHFSDSRLDKGGRLQVNLIIQRTLQCARRSSVSSALVFSYVGRESGPLRFFKAACKMGEAVIIAGIKDVARPKGRCLFSWM